MVANLVSVNLTTCDREEMCLRAVEYIIRQSYRPLEVVIVNDGRDILKVVSLIERFATDISFIYIKNTVNLGNAKSRNIALAHSNGEYIAFLDDDDFWHDPKHIEYSVKKLSASTSRFSYTGVIQSFECEDRITQYSGNNATLKNLIMAGNGVIFSPSIVIEKRLLCDVGGFDEKMKRGVDSDLYRRLIICQRQLPLNVDIVSVTVTEHDNSMTSVKSRSGILNGIHSQIRTLLKFHYLFLFYPRAFFLRLKSIIILLIRLVLVNKK